MHIVLLNDDALPSARGGSAVICEVQRQALKGRGYEVTLITTHQDGTPEKEWSDPFGRIISLPVHYPLAERHKRSLKMPAVSAMLDRVLQKLKPDVVHAHTIHTYLTYDALRVARTHTKKVFMTAHDTLLVSYGRVGSQRYIRDALKGRPHKLSVLDHIAAVGRGYVPSRNIEIRRALRESGATVISISHTLDHFLHANGIQHTVVIENALPAKPIPPDSLVRTFRSHLGLMGPTVLFGGRISADKGINKLFEAMDLVIAAVPDAQLLVVGDRERLDKGMANASERVRKQIVPTGWISQENMSLAYAAADVVTTPSIYLDAFNIMNIEAMHAGKPVVGTCFGGTAEIVVDSVTGYVRNPLDTLAFGEAITDLLKDPVRAKHMGEEGRARAEHLYGVDRHIERHLTLYST
ncbi:MAG TPA: glycosyltransferase family 4 protein [Candidatus Peribacteraceae bacterium]|nr:glycosyltransferase family 4 protein [Candidatus Peribacteraceae bacterium]